MLLHQSHRLIGYVHIPVKKDPRFEVDYTSIRRESLTVGDLRIFAIFDGTKLPLNYR